MLKSFTGNTLEGNTGTETKFTQETKQKSALQIDTVVVKNRGLKKLKTSVVHLVSVWYILAS